MHEGREPDGAAERAEALLAALARYRAGRALDGAARERAEMEAGAECLIAHAADAEERAAHHRRRMELIERAVGEGWMDFEMAGQVYDVAREEGLEPAFAFELVRCGVAVCEPLEPAPEATTLQETQPEWLERPVALDEASRERRLRMSFRRLRHLMEEERSPEEALIAFADEPDVRRCGY